MSDMSDIERAIFAAAYVDALRSVFDGRPMAERVKLAENEAEYIVACFRKHRAEASRE